VGPTQPPIQCVLGALSPGVKRGQGVMLTTHPLLVPKLRKSRSYTSSYSKAPLWDVTGPCYLYLTYCTKLIFLILIKLIVLAEEYKLWSFSWSNSVHLHVCASVLSPNILLGALFSNTVSLWSSSVVPSALNIIQWNPFIIIGTERLLMLFVSSHHWECEHSSRTWPQPYSGTDLSWCSSLSCLFWWMSDMVHKHFLS
jgi:hypothetical protein